MPRGYPCKRNWKYVFNGILRLGNVHHGQRSEPLRSVRDRIRARMILNTTFSLSPELPLLSQLPCLSCLCLCCFVQLAAQVLDDLDDEDIGFGLVDEKKDSAVAKKLGKLASHWQRPCWWKHCLIVNDRSRKEKKRKKERLWLGVNCLFQSNPTAFLMASPGVFTECGSATHLTTEQILQILQGPLYSYY